MLKFISVIRGYYAKYIDNKRGKMLHKKALDKIIEGGEI